MMAKKNTLTQNDILTFYMDHVLENGEAPKSVYKFCKDNSFNESEFYKYFGNFDKIESAVFEAFFDNTIKALENSEDYLAFNQRNKLLSFYFTLFENLTANRSYVLVALNQHKNSLKSLKQLKGFKNKFTHYIAELDIETLDIKQESIEKFTNSAIKESAWLQLLFTLKFWMDDDSSGFEKTDVFIEKSVNTSFDVMDIKPLKSLIDFGKFIFKEKIKMPS